MPFVQQKYATTTCLGLSLELRVYFVRMRVAIIGAGVAGLVACKYCNEFDLDVVVYEQCGDVGGTWIYSTDSGKNSHTSMYKNLVTNSPVEVMGFHDFEFPKGEKSYVTWKEVLDFIKSYEKHFKLTKFIKFEHFVTKVSPLEDENKWKVVGKYENEDFTEEFDAVFVCNGHFFDPNLPKINGIESFEGKIIHSHDYRDPEMFKGKKVLVVGSGPSGIDITFDLSHLAKTVHMSHHSTTLASDLFPQNVEQLPDIDFISDGKVHFTNSREENYDAIVLCTGYKYNFPFLSEDSGIKVTNNHVTPLYKHVINIEHPSMFFIGLTNVTIFNSIIELQVQFAIKSLLKYFPLPTKDEMYQELHEEMQIRHSKGMFGKRMHQLWPDFMRSYIDDVVRIADLKPILPVLLDIYDESRALSYSDIKNYRNYRYLVLDDRSYVKKFLRN
ncbi:senecionine N-oxygenase-like [Culicoides brevitarsis]|uniref:senecionine N-oxygenase-like n=1 Tax=Culicoides brevitarsis TaxID=469753 RepID=UPI00307B97BB